MTLSPALEQSAIDQCAREPIQIPGSIQPQGFLLVIEEAAMTVVQVSANVSEWLGIAPQALIGLPLSQVFDDAERLIARFAALPEEDQNPFHVGDVRFLEGIQAGKPIAMMAHRHDQVLIAEFEPASDMGSAYGNVYPLMRTFISQMQEAESIEALCQRSVAEVKRITGFGRVKAYQFDAEGNGLVIAEMAEPDYPTYLGLSFPGSDVPAQARALYLANRIRVIEDANYQPSPLVPLDNPVTGAPLDLSFATLRSVSPVHLQYMRNMQTLASMSISIVVRGQLWGLISCHHATPRAVSFQTRTACELLGSVLSLQIETKEAQARTERMLSLRRQIVQMLAAMADLDSVIGGLRAVPDVLLAFVGASGAAVISESSLDVYGETPGHGHIQALTQWLSQRGSHDVFKSDNVGRDIPELPELSRSVSGVLAMAISELHSNYIIWFRPEQTRVVNWAGRPEKAVDDSGSLSPRHSFALWQETVRGFSRPWDELDTEGVIELRAAVLGIVLRKAEEMAALADELKKSNKELEAFSYSVSHDLRAPLRHIAGYAELLGDTEGGKLSERGVRFLDNIGESARFAGTLVDNLLSFSQMGRSAMRFSEVDLNAMVEAMRKEMQPDYEGRDLQWLIPEPLPVVIADAAFLHLAMRNLLANAIKYTRTQIAAVIEIGSYEEDGKVVVYIRDNGVGFDMQYASKLFGVFQRLHRMEEFEGTGIGLASVRRIIERHDGSVWAQGELGQGATFYFALPKRSLTVTL
ncbi:GAF domain-containing protein [Pseudomonas sp. GD03842]|uniref:ATP-binding protein n=1 Tax=unclassified Pseudomonas TaxID=196821 RepID=UPI000D34AD09|nr:MULTISPECIES: ATP-binding protein [unclassified Pseudomonas]MDH0745635.1 GAF domain-containing protein [Pseudomonas sp. GD03842]RAU42149.1 GAF domain-containing protein [Pseudomonas sp. RIT 409]RAU49728.1 GAF domain-containing protein [Pseudomonas sp. RIT 412]